MENANSALFQHVYDIPELLLQLCELLARDGRLKTILALALTKRHYRGPALRVLWAGDVSFKDLLRTLPDEVINSEGDSLVFTSPKHDLAESNFAPFNFYRTQVRHVVGELGSTMDATSIEAFINWHQSRDSKKVLPHLRTLSVRLHDASIPSTARLVKAMCPSDAILHTSFIARTTAMQAMLNNAFGALLPEFKVEKVSASVEYDVPHALSELLSMDVLEEFRIKLRHRVQGKSSANFHALLSRLSGAPRLRNLVVDGWIAPEGAVIQWPAYPHVTSSALRSVRLPANGLVQLLPPSARRQLRLLTLDVDDSQTETTDCLVNCLATCSTLEKLVLHMDMERNRWQPLVDFPWHAIRSLDRLTSFVVVDRNATLRTPTDDDLGVLAEVCTGLEEVVWERPYTPGGVRGRPAATLNALLKLTSLPVVVLEIPIIVRGPCIGRVERRFATPALQLRPVQWFYEPIGKAGEWILAVLEAVCPSELTLNEWLEVDLTASNRSRLFLDGKSPAEDLWRWMGVEVSV